MARSQTIVQIRAVNGAQEPQGSRNGTCRVCNSERSIGLSSLSAIPEATDMSKEYIVMKVKKLYELLMFTFPGEEALNNKKNCMLLDPIFNHAVDKLNPCGRDVGVFFLQFYELIVNGKS